MIPRVLSILYSLKCNFFCSHCSVCSTSKHKELLELKYIQKAIDEAYNIPSIQVVGFTGGEPTLHPNHLKNSIKYASEHGFIVRLVTNAWWAGNHDKAREFLEELSSYGLKELNISYDDFHLEYLSKYGGERNILNAVKAGVDLGLDVLVGITRCKGSRITSKYIRELLINENLYGSVEFIEDFIAPLGRGKNLATLRDERMYNAGCKDIGFSIPILPDGRILACCGHILASEALSILTVGNIKLDTLENITKRIHRNVLYWLIHSRGPSYLLERFGENALHKCEACHKLALKKERLKSLHLKKKKYSKN